MPRIDESRPFIPVRIAVLTMSDTRSLADDKSGNVLSEMITEAGHEVAGRALVKDDIGQIRSRVQGWIDDPKIDVVITTGGTGFTGRDVTPEAVEPLFEKEDRWLLDRLSHDLVPEGRDLDHPVARLRWRGERHIYFLPAGITRRLQGCVARHPQVAARQPPPPLQFRRNHAAAGGASEIVGRSEGGCESARAKSDISAAGSSCRTSFG